MHTDKLLFFNAFRGRSIVCVRARLVSNSIYPSTAGFSLQLRKSMASGTSAGSSASPAGTATAPPVAVPEDRDPVIATLRSDFHEEIMVSFSKESARPFLFRDRLSKHA